MRKLLLLLLALLAAVGVCQETPSVAWSLQGPPAAPAPAYSPNGSWLVLPTNDGFRVFDSALKLKWFIPSRANGARVPVAAFSRDSLSLYALTNPADGEVSQYTLATGAFVRKANLFAAGSDPVKLVVLNSKIAALTPYTVNEGGTSMAKLNVKSYELSTLASLADVTVGHPNNLLPDRFAYGKYATGKEYVYLYDQQVDLATGAVTRTFSTSGGVDTEYWTVGVDSQGGLIQQVATKTGADTYSTVGYRRFRVSQLWLKTIAELGGSFVKGPMQFSRLADLTYVGLMGAGDNKKASVLNWQTGVRLFDTDLGVANKGFEFADGFTHPTKPNVALRWNFENAANGVNQFPMTSVFALDNAGVGAKTADLIAFPGGIAQSPSSASGVAFRGTLPTVAKYSGDGVLSWTIPFVGALSISEPAPTTGNVLVVLANKLYVLKGSDGSTITNVSGAFIGAKWIGDSKVLAFRTNAAITVYTFTGTALNAPFTGAGYNPGAAVSPDGAYVAGFNNGAIRVLRLSDKANFAKTQAISNPDGVIRMKFIANDKFAILTVPSPYTTFTWKTFTINANKTMTAGADISQTIASTGPATLGYIAADLNADGSIAAFYRADSVTNSGTPFSELLIKYVDSGLVIGDYKNSLPFVRDLKFSPDSLYLYTLLGGTTSSDRSDFMAIRVPNTLVSAVLTTTPPIYSGDSAIIKVTLSRPAGPGGQKILVTVPSGFVSNATVTVPAGSSTVNVAVKSPITTVALNAAVGIQVADSSSASSSATVNYQVLPATVTLFTATPGTIVGGATDVAVTVRYRGKVPAGVNLEFTTSDAAVIPMPAPIALDATGVATFTTTSSRVTANKLINLNVKLNGKSTLARVQVNVPNLVGFAFVEKPLRGGDTATAKVTILRTAPAGGETIFLKIETPNGTTDTTVTVPAGSKTAEFLFDTPTVSVPGTLKITAKSAGSDDFVISTPLLPAELSFFELGASSVKAGGTVKGYVALDGFAGPATSVTITTDSGRVTVPATLVIVDGEVFAEFDIMTSAGPRTTANISVTLGTVTITKALTILP